MKMEIKKINKILEYGLYFLVFLLPWQTRLIVKSGFINNIYNEYLSISLYLSDLLIWLLLTIWFLLFIYQKKTKQDVENNIKIKYYWWCLAALELFVFLSIFWSFDKYLALYRYFVFLSALAFFFLLLKINYQKIKLIYVFLFSMFVQALLALGQFVHQATWANKWLGLSARDGSILGASVIETGTGERWLRAYAGLEHPNIFGALMVFALLVVLSLYFKKEEKIKNFYLFLYALFFIGLLLSFSRAAGLAFLLAVLGYFIFLKIWEQKKVFQLFLRPFVLSLFIFLFFSWQLNGLFFDRFNLDNRLEKKSIEERTDSLHDSREIIKNNFFLGTGIGNYVYALSDREAWDYQPVHNVFLLLWAETGILALFFFVLLFILIFKELFETKKNPEKIAWLLALLVLFLFDHWWWSLHFGLLFMFFILALIIKKNHQIFNLVNK